MKRKITSVCLILVIIFAFGGCKKNDVDDQLIENTKQIEILDCKFSNYEITYKEYEEGLTDFVGKVDMAENLDRNFTMPNEEMKILSMDDLNVMAENRGTYSSNVEISRVYDYLDIKYVYTKAVLTPDDNNDVGVKLTETRRYVYVLEDDLWILSNIERRMYEKNVDTEDMDLVRFENELVEYVESFNPCDV